MKKLIFLFLFVNVLIAQTIFFDEDFETALSENWEIQAGWSQTNLDNNGVMKSSSHSFMVNNGNYGDFNLSFNIQFKSNTATMHVNTLVVNNYRHYIGLQPNGIYHHMQAGENDFEQFDFIEASINIDTFHLVNIIHENDTLKVFLDNEKIYEYKNSSIESRKGNISFEGTTDGIFYLDNIKLISNYELTQSTLTWTDLGGPMGGIGYDLRFDPNNSDIMYVSDNHSGVGKSTNRGKTWDRKNRGITIKGGPTSDEYNIFSLTVDQNNPNIIWAGTQGEGETFGIFKSTDGGENWQIKLNEISINPENNETGLLVRGFTVEENNSDIVYVQTEITTPNMGREFKKSKGRVYKTTNAGETWTEILEVDSLTRYLIIDPEDNNTLYVSTGIFDVEAYNSDCTQDLTMASNRGGEGVLKSTDGGNSWNKINSGLKDLYVGTLRMDPKDNMTLFAGTGNNACSILEEGNENNFVGLYKTTDGGNNWKRVINDYQISAVNISPNNSNIVYAAGNSGFFASTNAGETFSKLVKDDIGYGFGPDGIDAGFPIDLVVDPSDDLTVYINNYGGGVIKSIDGGKTWLDSSKGMSGATISKMHVDNTYPSRLYTIGRSGPFVSDNSGEKFKGLHNFVSQSEYMRIVSSPDDPNIVLLSSEFEGNIMRSENQGNSFEKVLTHSGINNEQEVDDRFGFKAITFAPSNPKIVLAGIASDKMMTNTKARDIPLPALYISNDSGKTFAPFESAIDASVNEISFDPNDVSRFFVATVDGLFITSNSGESFIKKLSGKWIEDIAISSENNNIYVGVVHEGIYKSDDFGQTWSGPLNTGFSSGTPYITSIIFKQNDNSILYASDYYSGVYKSDDSAQTWQTYPDFKQSGLLNRAVVDIASVEDTLYAGTKGGGVYRLGDAIDSSIVTADLNISSSWNLLALPVDTNISYEQLDSYFPNAQTIWTYDEKWYAYGKEDIQELLDSANITKIEKLSKAIGFWINSTNSTKVQFSGSLYNILTDETLRPNTSGWYLLGSGTNITPDELISKKPNIETIWSYQNGWKVHGNTQFEQLDVINQGEGFWIYIK